MKVLNLNEMSLITAAGKELSMTGIAVGAVFEKLAGAVVDPFITPCIDTLNAAGTRLNEYAFSYLGKEDNTTKQVVRIGSGVACIGVLALAKKGVDACFTITTSEE